MGLWRQRWFGQTRRSLRTLERIAGALEAHTTLLTRIADQIAPLAPLPTDVRDTGATFLDEHEQARVLDYVQKTTRDTGRPPSDDEVVQWLADEATAAQVRGRI